MNPFLSAVIGAILGLKRTCLKCKRDQVIPSKKRRERVRCKFCGADILPSM